MNKKLPMHGLIDNLSPMVRIDSLHRRGHFGDWSNSGLTQREYRAEHGLFLKNFGNWRGRLKREVLAGGNARWWKHVSSGDGGGSNTTGSDYTVLSLSQT